MVYVVQQFGAGEGDQASGAGVGDRARTAREARHRAAVASTLKQADDAAARADYADALSWLGLIEAIGDELPDGYEARREAWLMAIAAERAHGRYAPT